MADANKQQTWSEIKHEAKRESEKIMEGKVVCHLLGCLLISVMIAALSGCKRQEAPKSYKLIDTGMWTGEGGGKYKWLDNERVLFPSNENLTPQKGPNRMTVWNTSTGKVEFYHPWRGDYCVEGGEITFAVTDKNTRKVSYYRGPIEKPQEYPPPRPNMYMQKYFGFGCGWVDKDSREAQTKFPYRIRLRGDNFLEITGENEMSTPSGMSKKIAYFERQEAEPVSLPGYMNLHDSYSTKYIAWRDAYLISPHGYHPARPPHLWWVERDGRVQEEQLPKSFPFPMEGGIDFFPTPKGLFIHYNGGDQKKDRGGYILNNGKLEKIFKNSGRGVELSPDGCRVVFDHVQNDKDYFSMVKPYRTLKIINFCIEGGTQ